MGRRPMHVTIVAEEDSTKPDGVAFRMEDEDGCELSTLVFRKDHPSNPMAKKDVHEVHFKLEQEQGLTLEFAHSLNDVLWVEMGSETEFPPCPESQPAQPSGIFYAEKSTPNKLIAVNTNPTVQQFAFTVNFVDRTNQGPKKLIPYDPPGSNQNGGIGSSSDFLSQKTVVIAGAAAAILVLALLALR